MEARSDILWWTCVIEHWNGLSMMLNLRRSNPDITITSDASGVWGCGAYSSVAWFQYQWPPSYKDHHITIKELLPIVIATAIWGIDWTNKSILCRCDNEAVVHIINTGTSKDPEVMGLMRCLHFIAAKFNLLLSATHIAGVENSLANAVSRDNLATPLFQNITHRPIGSHLSYRQLYSTCRCTPNWTGHHQIGAKC